jgi:serine/threonine-protein kinase
MTTVRDERAARFRDAVADRYAIECEIGRGGAATVFLARDRRHDRRVALKVLNAELSAAIGAERFQSEIRLLARLQHPFILPLYDSGTAGGVLYYVMPYVEGQSLRDRLDGERQLPVREGLRIARQVAEALAYAHEHNVVHRDVKPENILLAGANAVVADFGIARAINRAVGERHTAAGVTLGTPAYMSPEQASGDGTIDGRSDVYSLACVLFEMLAGQPPFTGPTPQAVIARRFTSPPPHLRALRPSVPARVDRAVVKALALLPADRYATAGEFVAELPAAPDEAGRGGPWLRKAVAALAAALRLGR